MEKEKYEFIDKKRLAEVFHEKFDDESDFNDSVYEWFDIKSVKHNTYFTI